MRVLPFPCVRPTAAAAELVAAPPYDVFDRAEARAWVRDRPRSFLAIDRPETLFAADQDPCAPEVYARAAQRLREQMADGTYMADRAPCFYIYELASGVHVQRGVVATCALDDCASGVIRCHELTRPDKVRDRVAHITALGAQTGPVLLTYRDDAVLDAVVDAAAAAAPLYRFRDAEGVDETIWRIRRPETIEALRALFERIPRACIADGHHRAAAAARVAEDRRAGAGRAQHATVAACDQLLCVLVPAGQLHILPYHRCVADRNGLRAEELIDAVEAAGFETRETDGPVDSPEPGHFGLFTDGRWWELAVSARVVEQISSSGPAARLDVSVLQDRILAPVLGIGDPRCDARIGFLGGTCAARELERRAGAAGVAFSLHATGIDELLAVAEAGLLMPPKSTWFEPKLRSGLFIHAIR